MPWIARPQKPSIISNRVLIISRRNAFICIYSNFCPKIGCHGNAPLSLAVSQMNSPIAQTLSQNQSVHGYVAYNWRYGHFWPILAKIWLPWQGPLDHCSHRCLLWIARPRKPPIISNCILIISRRNAFIAIFVPKFVAMVTPLCPCARKCHIWIPSWQKPYLETKLCMNM